jgi:pimeloyl-ACP methyl ester carboxylesterase
MRLVRLDSSNDPNPEADIVFVHGLDGDYRKTWTGSKDYLFWPQWISQEFPTCRIWSFDYPAAKSDWFGGSSMPLVDRAIGFAHSLDAEGVGDRPCIFVTHSLGGLVTIQMLRHRRDTWPATAGPNRLIDKLAGIVSFATPHHGSFWASFATTFSKVCRPSLSTQDLERADHHLADLMHWFRVFVADNGLPLSIYCETQPLYGVALVVDRISADPGFPGVVPVPLDADHISICKCDSTDTLFYRGMCKFIRDRLTDRRPIAYRMNAEKEASIHLGLDNIPLRYSMSVATADSDLTLSYKLNREVTPPLIYPSLPYLDTLRHGGLLTARTYKRNAIGCSFPALDFKIVNNGPKTLFLSEAAFAVDYSRPLKYPVLIFRDRSDRSFELVNLGAGSAQSVQLRFTFCPSGDTPVFSADYRHTIDVGDIVEHATVDLQKEFERAESEYPAELVSRIEEAADRDQLVAAAGEVSWLEPNDNVRKVCRFVANVYIGSQLYGLPGPPSFIYDLKLRSNASAYTETVPVSQVIQAGATDRFQIALCCEIPSEHRFTVSLRSTDREVLSSEIMLEVFMPRSQFAIIRSRESIEQARSPFVADDQK